ncbi:leucine-rich repeat-containing protein 75B isoform X2 [Silurus meridionalis]|uniref:leucine-rich repeat-containing protein 75B isoform X2 n=1 Tax=Silurus meridionalis TaxID=175797 RepID=UPI001EEB1DF7|nr:leucine-rich repeat-containing protein 75B isoform X2 [Silurus meridionalis]
MGSRLSRQSSLDGGGGSRKRGGGGEGVWRRKRADSGGEREPSAPFPAAVMLLRSDRMRTSAPSPYVRRVAWIRDIQQLLRERKVEEAASVLKQLRKDLGLEGTSLNDILYKNAAFLNLVDPISHELLLSLARDMQCPKKDFDMLKSSDKICRQLIYHLTPHSKWLRQSMSRRKAQAWLKTTLQKKLCSDSVDLSGILLSTRDIRHVAYYLQTSGGAVLSVDLSFTELRDEGPDRGAEDSTQLLLSGLDRPREQCGHLYHASAPSGGAEAALQPEEQFAHYIRIHGGSAVLLPHGELHRGAEPL